MGLKNVLSKGTARKLTLAGALGGGLFYNLGCSSLAPNEEARTEKPRPAKDYEFFCCTKLKHLDYGIEIVGVNTSFSDSTSVIPCAIAPLGYKSYKWSVRRTADNLAVAQGSGSLDGVRDKKWSFIIAIDENGNSLEEKIKGSVRPDQEADEFAIDWEIYNENLEPKKATYSFIAGR